MTRKKKGDNLGEPLTEEALLQHIAEQEAALRDQAVLTANLQAEVENTRLELEKLQTQAYEYRDGWQRALADFSNMKRRTERDQAQAQQNATASIIRPYLDIVDDLDRALSNRPQEGETPAQVTIWVNGVELIYRKLMNILENEGVTTILAEGLFFDPSLHEAIVQEDSAQHESGQIIGVVQQGYRLGDRILRPARVRVAR